jgi:hypothetical protein
VAAYNSVLNYYVKRNDAAGVERIQAMIAEHAVKPDEATGNMLLRFLVGRGDWKAAYEVRLRFSRAILPLLCGRLCEVADR